MKLMTKALRDKLPALYSTDGIPADEKRIVVKFFDPCGSWTWYVVEGDPEGEDIRFYGLVHGQEKEWGYFMLSELQSVKGPMGVGIERDLHFGAKTISDLRA